MQPQRHNGCPRVPPTHPHRSRLRLTLFRRDLRDLLSEGEICGSEVTSGERWGGTSKVARPRIACLERVLARAIGMARGGQIRDRSKMAVWIPPENEVYSDLLSSVLNTEVILVE